MTTEDTSNTIVVRGGDYEHTAMLAGRYGEITLGYEVMGIGATFKAMTAARAFEVCEFSLANYLTLRASGADWLTAIPVFPYRAFRHSLAVTRRESALASLKELAGKRVGVEDYSMTAAVWFRALLRDEYGVDHRSICWVTRANQRFPFPAGAHVETTEADPETLLCEGSLDAILAVSTRDSRLPLNERRLRPVLPEAQAAEEAYYRRTALYPIHHCIVIRNDVLARHPRIAAVVYGAYEKAKQQAYARRLGTTLAPWSRAHWERVFDLFAGDPRPYGWTPANRAVVERLAGHLHEQGFIACLPDVDALFARVTAP